MTPDSTNYLIHHSLPTTVLTDRFQESGFNLLNRLRMRTVPLRYILFPLTPYLNSMLLSISLSSELLFSITKKEQPSLAALLGEGIFTMGYSKNYIMYWGVFTVYIVPCVHQKVCTKFTKFNMFFCALYSFVSATSSFSVVKSASNSSRCTFSFSRRRAAQL